MTLKAAIIPVTPFEQNCALVWDETTKQAAIFDPGGDVDRILSAIAEHAVTVENIFLTHGHIDHAGGATELAAKLDLKITGPAHEDEFLLQGMAAQARQFGLTAQNCKPDAWLKEGDKITLGSATFEVLHCPGHTPGHLVFINRDANFGVFGDVLFRNSIGRTDFPYGDHDALIHAIQTKLMVLPDTFAFLCGHGTASTIGAERRSNPYVQ